MLLSIIQQKLLLDFKPINPFKGNCAAHKNGISLTKFLQEAKFSLYVWAYKYSEDAVQKFLFWQQKIENDLCSDQRN